MLDRAVTLSAAALLAVAATLLPGASAHAARRRPVVAELYTSQGCSACAAANALPAELEGRKGVLALTFPVDYWDYLGWRDTFAQPDFSERQHAYAKALGLREVYTPQVVIDGAAQTGRTHAGQSLPDDVDALIDKAAKAQRPGPSIRLRHGKVEVGAGHAPPGGADVWLVRYEAAPAEVAVKAGETSGQTVRYHNVARTLDRLGAWTGNARAYAEPGAPESGLKIAVLIQAKGGGRILAAIAP